MPIDPFTAVTGIAGLLSSVVDLSIQITDFASKFRHARRDMLAVARELVALKSCLETLREDVPKARFPDQMTSGLASTLEDCEQIINTMSALIKKFGSDSVARQAQWAATGKAQIDELRLKLEGCIRTLDLLLEMTSLWIISEVKDDTTAIKEDTIIIRGDTAQITGIVRELGIIRSKVEDFQQQGHGGAAKVQSWLKETVAYTETLLDPQDFEEIQRELTSSSLEDFGVEQNASDAQSIEEVQKELTPSPVIEQNASDPEESEQLHDESALWTVNNLSAELVAYSAGEASQPPFRKPDHHAIARSKEARSKLLPIEQTRLDEKLEFLVGGGMSLKGHTVQVGTYDEILEVLDQGAEFIKVGGAWEDGSVKVEDALAIELKNTQRSEVVELLLSRGANVDLQAFRFLFDLNPRTKLPRRASSLRKLLEYGLDPNGFAPGGTVNYSVLALACASAIQRASDYTATIKHVEVLLEYGAKVNTVSGYFGSCLNRACAGLDVQMVDLLLKHKADVHLESGALNLDSMGAALYQFRPPRYDIHRQDIVFYKGGKANYNAIVKLLKEHGATSEHPDAENVFAQYDKRVAQELAPQTAKRRSKFKFWDQDN